MQEANPGAIFRTMIETGFCNLDVDSWLASTLPSLPYLAILLTTHHSPFTTIKCKQIQITGGKGKVELERWFLTSTQIQNFGTNFQISRLCSAKPGAAKEEPRGGNQGPGLLTGVHAEVG